MLRDLPRRLRGRPEKSQRAPTTCFRVKRKKQGGSQTAEKLVGGEARGCWLHRDRVHERVDSNWGYEKVIPNGSIGDEVKIRMGKGSLDETVRRNRGGVFATWRWGANPRQPRMRINARNKNSGCGFEGHESLATGTARLGKRKTAHRGKNLKKRFRAKHKKKSEKTPRHERRAGGGIVSGTKLNETETAKRAKLLSAGVRKFELNARDQTRPAKVTQCSAKRRKGK